MANDVEIVITDTDRTGPGAASARAKMRGVADESNRTSKVSVMGAATIGSAYSGLAVRMQASGSTIVKALATPQGAMGALVGATVVGAAAGGAALAGLGLAYIGLGAFALRGKKSVVDAATALRDESGKILTEAASDLELPFTRSLGRLKATMQDIAPEMRGAIGSVASSIPVLTEGINGLANNAMPGLENAGKGANKVLIQLGNYLPELGKDVSNVGDSLAGAADGGGKALVDVLELIGTAATHTAGIIEITAKSYDFLDQKLFDVEKSMGMHDDVMARNQKSYREQKKALEEMTFANSDEVQSELRVNEAVGAGIDGFSTKAASLQATKAEVEALERANYGLEASIGSVNNAALASAGTELAANQARRAMVKELQDGARTFQENTVVGDENRQMMLRGITAAIKFGETEKARTRRLEDGQAAQQRHTDALYNAAIATGVDRREVDKLWKSLGLLPPSKAPKVSAPGAVKATADVRALNHQLASLRDRRINVTTEYRSVVYGTVGAGTSGGARQSGEQRYAHGGIVGAANGGLRNGLTMVGENGPELAELPPGTFVYPAGKTADMVAGGGAGRRNGGAWGGGGDGAQLVLVSSAPTASRDLMDVIIEGLRYRVATQAGGNAQTLLGR